MAKAEQKLQAFELRREGKSVKEVASQVGVTRGTASKWLKDLPMTQAEKSNLEQNMFERGNRCRMIFLEKGKKIYENREVYYGVVTLYIAKGTDLRYKILAFIARAAEVEIMSG